MNYKTILLIFIGIALINSQCSDPDVPVGNLCLTPVEAQDCFDHMDDLSAATEENPSIDNVCEPFVEGDSQRYTFTISYNLPYFHNDECNTQEIEFQGTPLNEDEGPLNEWQFDPVTQTIEFNISHDDIDGPKYNCFKDTNDDEYVWQCEMELNILLGGVEQLTYGFHITIILSRVYENTLNVTVVKNEVIGDCCENELNIVTELNFCEDFTCDDYLPDGLVVVRKQDIFVEHSIASPEFDYYFLHGLSLKLGPFYPDIIDTDGSQAGRYIYQFQSNIALPDMVLEVVSRIAENPERRRLQESEIGDDYKLKATANISIDEYEEKADEVAKEKQTNGVLIGVLATVGALLFISMVGAGLYCLKIKRSKAQRQEQYNVDKVEVQA